MSLHLWHLSGVYFTYSDQTLVVFRLTHCKYLKLIWPTDVTPKQQNRSFVTALNNDTSVFWSDASAVKVRSGLGTKTTWLKLEKGCGYCQKTPELSVGGTLTKRDFRFPPFRVCTSSNKSKRKSLIVEVVEFAVNLEPFIWQIEKENLLFWIRKTCPAWS